ncbi:AIPR family protein [Clostridium paraputrificum]|uniref:AIPR family protein n=1 Tax=Clostridium paraputrificum TaxID=29363 RepID=UPI00232F2ACC|nr:AIPR family protein [Clostridium paraputrificum]MDB2119972.1 AIPR family protein [Clostridium paraputrificum]
MDLKEYKELVMEEILVAAKSNISDVTSEFINYVTSQLIDAEEFDDFTETYFETTKGRKKIQIDGFSFDEVDKTCIVLITDFSNENELSTIISSDIDRLYSRMEGFVTNSLNGYIRNNCEESSGAYGFAREIEERIGEITKFRFYIITDKILSDRVKSLNKEDISNKPVELTIWDMSRLYNLARSKMQKESIEINLAEYMNDGLPSILAVDCEKEQYKSYLTVIPGDMLANLYIKYGSRLLEGNVRSFLSIRGKVNKQIRSTILNKPEMFFAYNNGIAATATEAKCEVTENGLVIKSLKDLQIIIGGQTTASIANAVLQDKCDVSNIMVPMKLSIVDNSKATEIIPVISRCANSQNKVDEADFFSNHPYHIRMEEYSRKVFAPAIGGNLYQTIWFYERARGQHTQEQMKLTKAERNKYLLKNPKNQVIKKVDLAKYINTYEGYPHIVSRGAQTSMREFATRIDKKWNLSDSFFNEYYYKKTIALAIMFKQTEKIVSNQGWYKEIKSYRANIVTYTLSILFYLIKKELKDYTLDFKKIWNEQKIYPQLERQIEILSKEVFEFITREDRLTLNVTEWCKKELCWQRAQKENWTIIKEFLVTLVVQEVEKQEIKEKIKERKIDNEISIEVQVVKLGSIYWNNLLEWGIKRNILTPMEQSVLRIAASIDKTGKIPSIKQCNVLLKIKDKAYDEGYSA